MSIKYLLLVFKKYNPIVSLETADKRAHGKRLPANSTLHLEIHFYEVLLFTNLLV